MPGITLSKDDVQGRSNDRSFPDIGKLDATRIPDKNHQIVNIQIGISETRLEFREDDA